ncbi:hypothetical protein [Verrucomicrobium spinosum]|uniref:hypothetical protein n=1 Tax=Verrucomicrobium spinosum TaxID=2736 RepID=UPI0012E14278|nr:hypothetical protein [Verrucomicrobium spinosum]
MTLVTAGGKFTVNRTCGGNRICTRVELGEHINEESLPADLPDDPASSPTSSAASAVRVCMCRWCPYSARCWGRPCPSPPIGAQSSRPQSSDCGLLFADYHRNAPPRRD